MTGKVAGQSKSVCKHEYERVAFLRDDIEDEGNANIPQRKVDIFLMQCTKCMKIKTQACAENTFIPIEECCCMVCGNIKRDDDSFVNDDHSVCSKKCNEEMKRNL